MRRANIIEINRHDTIEINKQKLFGYLWKKTTYSSSFGIENEKSWNPIYFHSAKWIGFPFLVFTFKTLFYFFSLYFGCFFSSFFVSHSIDNKLLLMHSQLFKFKPKILKEKKKKKIKNEMKSKNIKQTKRIDWKSITNSNIHVTIIFFFDWIWHWLHLELNRLTNIMNKMATTNKLLLQIKNDLIN